MDGRQRPDGQPLTDHGQVGRIKRELVAVSASVSASGSYPWAATKPEQACKPAEACRSLQKPAEACGSLQKILGAGISFDGPSLACGSERNPCEPRPPGFSLQLASSMPVPLQPTPIPRSDCRSKENLISGWSLLLGYSLNHIHTY